MLAGTGVGWTLHGHQRLCFHGASLHDWQAGAGCWQEATVPCLAKPVLRAERPGHSGWLPPEHVIRGDKAEWQCLSCSNFGSPTLALAWYSVGHTYQPWYIVAGDLPSA